MPTAKNPPFEGSYEALDYRFRVRTRVPRMGLVADRLLRPFRTSGDGRSPVYSLVRLQGDAGYDLRIGRRRLHQVLTPGAVLGRLIFEINQQAIRCTKSSILIHAGAVAWQGKGVLLPAKMESGKTTLVAGLIQAGFDYLTDEAAVLDPKTGRLHPYPKPLSVEHASVELLPGLRQKLLPEFAWPNYIQYQVPPIDLRPGSVGRTCSITHVVLPQYRPGAPTILSSISRAAALFGLAENTFNLQRFGARGLQVLADLLRNAECYRLSMNDLPSSVGTLKELVQYG